MMDVSEEKVDVKVVEEDDKEMKEEFDPGHVQYMPHLWRSVPEHLWGIWRDICRPNLGAIHTAHVRGDMGVLENALMGLLEIPGRTLRRIRGTKNIFKAHLGLEYQLQCMSLRGEVPGRNGESRQEEVREETPDLSKESRKQQRSCTRVIHVERYEASYLMAYHLYLRPPSQI